MNWQDIPGNSTDIEGIYVPFLDTCSDDDVIIELGVYAGRSLAMLVQMARVMGKAPRVWGVDLWEKAAEITAQGNDGKNPYKPIPYGICQAYLQQAGVLPHVILMQMDTAESSKHFMDGAVSLAFVDGDHNYAGVKRDIRAWRSKIKPGGTLAGHDFTEEYRGVMKAVLEEFPDYVHDHSKTGMCWTVKL